MSLSKPKAPRNRTLTLTAADRHTYAPRLQQLTNPASLATVLDHTLHQDCLTAITQLPAHSVDLLILDPP